jgi:hypothetical protein
MSNERTSGLSRSNASSKALSFLLLIALATLALPAAPLMAASTPASLNLVTVNIQTTADLPFQYTLTAYNTSGYQVASYYGNYPRAAFGLPSGTYLLTASASYQQSYVCKPCLPLASSNGSATALPIRYIPPSTEYGYAVETVSSDASVTIKTANETTAPLVSIPIHVAYANGTPAVGASVSGYEVGSNGAYSSQAVTYGQTGEDGTFTLVMPEAPIQVNAYMSLPIQLPGNVSTVTVTVGGEKVNVTLYWQPNYLNLAGQALVLPPKMGADIILQPQQSNPYPIYYNGAGGSVTTVTTIMSTTTSAAIPAQQSASSSAANKIAPFSAAGAPAVGATDYISSVLPYAVVGAAGLILGGGATLLLKRKKL